MPKQTTRKKKAPLTEARTYSTKPSYTATMEAKDGRKKAPGKRKDGSFYASHYND